MCLWDSKFECRCSVIMRNLEVTKMNIISINIDFGFVTETIKVVLQWLSKQCSRTSVHSCPTIDRYNVEGLGVQYTVTRSLDSVPTVYIVALICRARKLQYFFRECSGTLKERRDYLRRTTRLVCQACDAEHPATSEDKLSAVIGAVLRRTGRL
jgi:hypothetical protein